MIRYPIKRNRDCVFKYLYGSLNLYSDQILDDEYIIISPNNDKIITDINKVLSIFFILSTLLNYMFLDKKN